MSKINCKADNCTYNSDRCCKKDDVQIEGRAALNSTETCCGSFQNKTNCKTCGSQQ